MSYGSTRKRERRALFRDADNFDFRPLAGGPLVDTGTNAGSVAGVQVVVPDAPATVGAAPDIGAYEHGSVTYWIPGAQLARASSPVPPDNATGVLPDADLMFLPGKAAASHRVYLAAAGAAPLLVGELSREANVVTPSSLLLPGSTYRWRVDAVASDGAVTAGSDWSFTVGCADVDCVDCGGAPHTASCVACAANFSLLEGRCTSGGGCLDGRWDVNATATTYAPGASGCDSDTWVCSYYDIAGEYDDDFAVVSVANDNCARFGNPPLGKAELAQNGVSFQGLTCDNNAYVVNKSFTCHLCDTGFVLDTAMPSGCRLLPPPPSVPPPLPSLPPPSPPPSPPPPSPPPPSAVPKLHDDVTAAIVGGVVGGVVAVLAIAAAVYVIKFKAKPKVHPEGRK